jgi:translocation and assembly module TamB
MTRPARILIKIGVSLVAIVIVLIIAALITVQTAWFQNFARNKIASLIENSTGGRVEIGSFSFSLRHLSVTIKNFVLHGTEPPTAAPLLRVASLDAEVKLIPSFHHAIDLEHLGVTKPEANILVFPNGKTNLPTPKTKSKSSNQSGLKTVVDLAVKHFELTNGAIHFRQESIPVDMRGDNLAVILRYDTKSPAYDGSLKLDPIISQYRSGTPLTAHLNVPVRIEEDAVRIQNARLFTNDSNISLSATMEHMAAPAVTGKANMHLSVPEIERTLNMPHRSLPAGVPTAADAQLAFAIDSRRIDVQTASLTLGESNLHASGVLKDPTGRGSLQFQGQLALSQLAIISGMSLQPQGNLFLDGNARIDPEGRYTVAGNLNGPNLTAKNGAQKLGPVSIATSFHAVPNLLELPGLNIHGFGGELLGKAELRDARQLAADFHLSGLDLQKLSHDFGYKPLGYSGRISGDLTAGGDIKAKGMSGYTANLLLQVAGGNSGIPVNGRVHAELSGKTETVSLERSYVALPHTRIDLAGVLGQHLNLNLLSKDLHDFAPLLASASSDNSKSQTMPVAMQGGTATIDANIDGPLRSPAIAATAQMSNFTVEGRRFDKFAADLRATASGASVTQGLLQRQNLQAQFSGGIGLSHWTTTPQSPLHVNASIHNGKLEDLVALAGQQDNPITGTLNASANVSGTLSNPLGDATANVMNATAYGEPIQHANLAAHFSDQLIQLQPVQIVSGATQLTASATYSHLKDSLSNGHLQLNVATNTFSLSELKALESRRPGVAGTVQLTADVAADVVSSGKSTSILPRAINANLSARGLKDNAGSYGDLTASAKTTNQTVTFGLKSDLAGSTTDVNGAAQLVDGYPVNLDASVRSLNLEKALLLARRPDIPVQGILSATAHVQGPLKTPRGNLSLNLAKAVLYGEPITSLNGQLAYEANRAQISDFRLNLPAGSLQLNGDYTHPPDDFRQGMLTLHATTDALRVGEIHTVQQMRPGLKGTLRLLADISTGVNLENKQNPLAIKKLDTTLNADAIQYNAQNFGSFHLTTKTSGPRVTLTLNSDLAQASLKGQGDVALTSGYPAQATLNFSNIRYANFAPLLAAVGSQPETRDIDSLIAGTLSVKGPLLQPANLSGDLRFNQLTLSTSAARQAAATGQPVVLLSNQGPIDIALDHSNLDIRSFHLTGRSTDISAGGNIDFSKSQQLHLKLTAKSDLALLQQMSSNIYSSGNLTADVDLRGTFAQPLANGKVELQNASVNMLDSPNGISNANGTIVLNGTTARVRNLTAESGGGKITLSGFAALTGKTVRYALRANGTKVRTRFSGASVTSDLAIALNGTLQHSLLNGTVTITRVALAASSDAGSILSSTATPPETPSAPSGPLQGMRLDIHVVTSSGLAVQTSVARNLSANADLTIRGTVTNPGVLGQVVITQGNLVFFGNEYTVSRGVINFYDPTKVEPVLDISLQTSVQGVNVTLGVTGPIDNMKLNYRSDPPLRFDEIVSLLAAGKTPTSDPTIAANQPQAPTQSIAQMGESAIVSQAVAAPISSRLQRVFGVNQIKIDPTFTSGSTLPQARVTLQQQISPTILFTYTTDVTDTTAQIIRVEWAFTPRFSAVATRNEFGILSLDFFWKKQLK